MRPHMGLFRLLATLTIASLLLSSTPPQTTPRALALSEPLRPVTTAPTTRPAAPANPGHVTSPPIPHPEPPPASLPAQAAPPVTPDLHQLPLAFVPNQGQSPDAVRFQVRALGGTAFLTDDALVLTLPASRPPEPPREMLPRPGEQVRDVPYRALRMAFVGATPATTPRGEAPLPGTTSYLLGNDPARWRHALPSYAGVVYSQLYPGIDLHYTGDGGLLKRSYTLAPGADPSRIRWRYTGAAELRLDASGNLSATLPLPTPSPTATAQLGSPTRAITALLATPVPTATAVLTPSTLVEHAPVAWQDVDGQRVPVAVRYVIGQDGSVGFALGAYDHTRPLTIDPLLTYSTYLGGSGTDVACGVAVDDHDAIYVVGYTYSSDFITTTGAYTTTWAGNADVFVTKLDATGSLVYSTFLGGSGAEYNPYSCPGIAVNQAHRAYLAGRTDSSDFPTLHAFDATYHGGDIFVTVLNAAGADLIYSTYLGGPNDDWGEAITVDGEGIAYVGGFHCCGGGSPPFPIRNAYQGTYGGGGNDGVIVRIDPALSGNASLLSSTFLGGNDQDLIRAIALDPQGNIYVAGLTDSPNGGGAPFPTTAGAPQGSEGGQFDTFVAKFDPTASQLLYSTYLGGNYDDWGTGLAVDNFGQATVVGWTNATNYPTTPNAVQAALAGGTDLFIAQLNASGTDWRWSTYLGGSGTDEANAVTATRTGRLVVTGQTHSLDFPNAKDMPQDPSLVSGDVVLASFDSASGHLLWSSQFGGSANDVGYALAPQSSGALVVVGQTVGGGIPSFPIVNGFQASGGGGVDAFVAVVARGALPPDHERTQGCDCDAQKDWPFPVNTRTGNYWTRATDLAVAGTGPALSFTRTYASQSITETLGALGVGWQHIYATRVITPGAPGSEPNTIIVLSPENNRLRYADLGGGHYAAWPGVYSTLQQGSGVYTQTLRTQAQYVFNATTGRLQAISDGQGRALSLTYNGSNQLTQVADAADATRVLHLSYDGSGHIQSVDDGVRSVSYSYSNDDLVAVTDVMGRTTSYGYHSTPSPTHLLTSITDPIGQVVEQVGYDSYTVAGKVITQTLQDGSALAFEYLSASTVITTTGVDGRQQVAQIGYAGDNTMTGQAVNGQTVLGTAFDDSFSPAVAVDGNGNTTTTSYNADGLPLDQVNALGQRAQAVYDAHDNLLETSDALGVTTRYRYDAQNNVISQTVGITTTSPLRATTLLTYTNDSRLLEQQAPDGVVTRYRYDAQNRVISSTVGYGTPLGQTTTYGYDQFSRIVTTTVGVGTPLARQDVTRYNLDNTVHQTIQNYQDGVFTPAAPDEDIVTTYGYDGLGRTVAVTDTLGHLDLTHYDAAGRVDWTARNAVGALFDAHGLPLYQPYSRLFPDRNVNTLYGYDGLGRSTFVTETGILTGTFNTSTLQFSDVTTRTTRTEYDGLSRPVTTTLNYRAGLPSTADMNIALYTRYDGAGNVITQTDALGRWTVMQYDALNRPVTTTLNYDDGDPLTGPADADLVSLTRYDAAGRVERTIENFVDGVVTATDTITDRITLYDYDTLSRVVTTTLAYAPGLPYQDRNRQQAAAYDPLTTRVLAQHGWGEGWISQQYDLLGRVTTSIQNCLDGSYTAIPTGCGAFDPNDPDHNLPTSRAYDALGRTTIVTDALDVATQTTYDGLGRAVATTRNWVLSGPTTAITNVTTLTAYDGLGRTIVMTDALGYASHTGYNALGQTTILTDTIGRVTHMGYDGQGMLRWTKRNDGQLTVYTVDGLGRTVATIVNYQDGVVGGGEPSDQDLISRTIYDAAGRRLAAIDLAGRATAFTYDNLDRLIAVTINAVSGGCAAPPCNLTTQYQYDRVGNRTAIIDARGNTRTFTYDAADRVILATDPLNHQTEWDYQGPVLHTLFSPISGMDLDYQYDRLNRPSEVSSLAWAGLLATSYDARGQRTASDMPGHGRTTYQYDPLGRIRQVTAPGTGSVSYGYDARGQRSQLSYPNGGPTLEYAYWPDGQLKVVTDTTTLASYSYDTVGRLATVARANGATTNYTYDDADRLTEQHTTVGGSTRSRFQYTLDRLGQRMAVTETLGLATRVITYSYDGLQRLSSAGESPGTLYDYAYDDAGNRTGVWVNGSQVVSQSYNAADEVVGYTYDAAGNLTDDGTHTYGYDAFDRLIQRDSTTYTLDADGVLVGEMTGGSTISYTQDLASPLSQILQTVQGGTVTDHLYGLDRLASETSGTRTWYSSDALGSLRQTLNASGSVLGSINYDPWGQVESGITPGFGFTGEMQDSLGMVYLRARWYNPQQGTFTARDPFEGFAEQPYSLHPYQYGLSDPVLMTDPTGRAAAVDPSGGISREACKAIHWVWTGDIGTQRGYCLPPPPPPQEDPTGAAARVHGGAQSDDGSPDCAQPQPQSGWDDLLRGDRNTTLNPLVGAPPWPAVGGRTRGRTGGRIGNLKPYLLALLLSSVPAVAALAPNYPQEEKPNFVRVRHYSRRIDAIRADMLIKVNTNMGPFVWVEYPIVTPNDEQAIQRRASRFFIAGGVDGFVEFNVDLNKWSMEQDPNIPYDSTAKIIKLGISYATIGFPLTEPGVSPMFFDAKGNPK
jgi:RHS repeat-associated protein